MPSRVSHCGRPLPCRHHPPASRANTTPRGYGWPHQRLRNAWRPSVEAGIVTCARCGNPSSRARPGTSDVTTTTEPSTPAANTPAATGEPPAESSLLLEVGAAEPRRLGPRMRLVECLAAYPSVRTEGALVYADGSVGPLDPKTELVALHSAAPSPGGAVVQRRAPDEVVAVRRMLPDFEKCVIAVALMNVPAACDSILGHGAYLLVDASTAPIIGQRRRFLMRRLPDTAPTRRQFRHLREL